jgi:hypothetical protein
MGKRDQKTVHDRVCASGIAISSALVYLTPGDIRFPTYTLYHAAMAADIEDTTGTRSFTQKCGARRNFCH